MKYAPWILLPLLVGGWVLLFLFHQGYRFNATPSMPRGIYQLVRDSPVIDRGDLVSVCLEVEPFAALALERGYLRSGSYPCGLEPLLKIIAGMPGDSLDINPNGILVNDQLQPESHVVSLDSRNRPMPVALSLTPGVIPDGMALVLSDGRPGGFDGRYFGLVPLTSLQKVRPIRIFDPVGD
jgi:conjugative transfer signal peptidase TraF